MSTGTGNAVSVAVRCRPLVSLEVLNGPYECLECNATEKKVYLEDRIFAFDIVFDEKATQRDVYNRSVAQLTDKFLSGSDVAVIAYGQTGTGKTYTIGTDDELPCTKEGSDISEDAGIISRTLYRIYGVLRNARARVQFFEIYNEECYDLLNTARPRIFVREDDRQVKMPGLTEVEVSSYESAMQCLVDGAKIRTTGATAMNSNSSRSHAIFSLILQGDGASSVCHRMMLVDLAGSETVKKTKTSGKRFKEGVNINLGLLSLGGVINALSKDKGCGYVPYRDSTLTRVLQKCLHGNCQSLIITCISPLEDNVTETRSTLRFAEHARAIKVRPSATSVTRFADAVSARKQAPYTRVTKLSQCPVSAGGRTPATCVTPFVTRKVAHGSVTGSTESVLLDADATLQALDKVSPAVERLLPIAEENSEPPPLFMIPMTPVQQQCHSLPSSAFSPLVRKICMGVEVALDRVVDRLARSSRNMMSTPARESLVDAIVRRISLAQQNYAIPNSGLLDVTLSRHTTTLTLQRNSTVRSLEQSAMESPPVGKENMDFSCKRTCSVLAETPVRRSVRRPTISSSCRTHTVVKRSRVDDVNRSVLVSPENAGGHTQKILHLLNNGSVRELEHLPCVGPKTAVLLHNWRTANGAFASISNLRSVCGLSASVVDKFIKGSEDEVF